MPCPAIELGAVEPFIAVYDSEANTGRTSCDGWRAITCGTFGHGMPCPYGRNGNCEKNGFMLAPSIDDIAAQQLAAKAGLPVLLKINPRPLPERREFYAF